MLPIEVFEPLEVEVAFLEKKILRNILSKGSITRVTLSLIKCDSNLSLIWNLIADLIVLEM